MGNTSFIVTPLSTPIRLARRWGDRAGHVPLKRRRHQQNIHMFLNSLRQCRSRTSGHLPVHRQTCRFGDENPCRPIADEVEFANSTRRPLWVRNTPTACLTERASFRQAAKFHGEHIKGIPTPPLTSTAIQPNHRVARQLRRDCFATSIVNLPPAQYWCPAELAPGAGRNCSRRQRYQFHSIRAANHPPRIFAANRPNTSFKCSRGNVSYDGSKLDPNRRQTCRQIVI